MREHLHGDQEAGNFAALLDIGNGAINPEHEHPDGFITLTKRIPSTSENLSKGHS